MLYKYKKLTAPENVMPTPSMNGPIALVHGLFPARHDENDSTLARKYGRVSGTMERKASESCAEREIVLFTFWRKIENPASWGYIIKCFWTPMFSTKVLEKWYRPVARAARNIFIIIHFRNTI